MNPLPPKFNVESNFKTTKHIWVCFVSSIRQRTMAVLPTLGFGAEGVKVVWKI